MNIDNNISGNAINPSILIVDDNPQNLQVLGRLLQDKNYKIEFATNGKAALEWLDSEQFDLILLDINMPEMNGFEVCQKIKSNEKLSKVPIIFLTADTDRESVLKGFEMGAQDFITKPFDSRELLVRVKTHISLKESLEKLERINWILEEKVSERTLQLKNANEKLEIMNQKLTELDDTKSEFLSLISHEIRTPLNGIMGPVELLKSSSQSSESGELFEILDTSVKRLEKFALNALLITRLKTRPNDIIKTEIDLGKILEDAINEAMDEMKRKELSLKRQEGKMAVKILGEPDLLHNCILNIIDNAVTFSPDGSSIEISTFIEGQHLILEINDSGNGIPAGILEKGAEPFTRGKEYHDKSTGVGLPLSKMIMEAHGGSLELKNRPEGGASVRLRFNFI
jgi:two-component system, sensor histidine kinase and response regulator